MGIKNAVASCLVIALGLILGLHFALFWVYGGVFIHESNKIILAVETAMSVAILAFGVERLASTAMRKAQPQAAGVSDRTPSDHGTQPLFADRADKHPGAPVPTPGEAQERRTPAPDTVLCECDTVDPGGLLLRSPHVPDGSDPYVVVSAHLEYEAAAPVDAVCALTWA